MFWQLGDEVELPDLSMSATSGLGLTRRQQQVTEEQEFVQCHHIKQELFVQIGDRRRSNVTQLF